jgi:two-component system sensor histidine kinase DesK
MTERAPGPDRRIAGDVQRTSPALPRDGAWLPFFRVIGIVFVLFPIVTIASRPVDAFDALLVVAGTALFGTVMALGARLRFGPRPGDSGFAEGVRVDSIRIGAVLGLLAVALALSLHDPEAGWFAFFYYGSAAASTIRNGRIAIGLMVVAGILAGLAVLGSERDPGGAIVQGLSVAVIGMTVYSAIAVRRTNRALVHAREELARLAVADERARIARDLHDTLGHSLSVIALKSELAGRLLPDHPERARSEIGDVERVARDALSAVRETVSGYRQPRLAAELAGASSTFAAAGLEARVEPAPADLPPAVDAILGWAVREGVTNVVRHGRASSADIRVARSAAAVEVEIVNDRAESTSAIGPGGRPAGGGPLPGAMGGAGGPEPAPAGSGLSGLRERVAAVGGAVEAGPTERGFRLLVRVPLGSGGPMAEGSR